MGVASLQAAERFDTTASELAGLAVMQLAVYAVMQIPVGLLLDKYGSKRLLLVGSLAMVAGQFLVAFASQIEVAYLGRALVGFGDAFIFISMVRLIVAWNTSKLIAKRQQLMTSIGQMGQIASAVFFSFLLATVGWSSAFTISAGVVVLGAIAVLVFVTNEPIGVQHSRGALSLRNVISQLGHNLRFAGTRMSFWVHFTLQSSGSVFALLWGVPYLVTGQNQSVSFANSMLILQTLLGFVFGFVLGSIASNRPEWRVRVVFINAIAMILAWLVMAVIDGPAPTWLLIVLVTVISSGGPASMYAMDFSRGFIPPERLGSANGFINVGGFLATFSTMALAGLVLDVVQKTTDASSPFTPLGFRWAMSVQIVVLAMGLSFFAFELAKTRKTHQI
jgi:MFS family permease